MGANEPGQPPLTVQLGATGWTRDRPTPASALAIGAHPDDVEFGAGATLAKWAAAGSRVHYLVCTDGSKGTWKPDANMAALITAREVEQRAAARVIARSALGTVEFLGCVDGELDSTITLRGKVARWIRLVRPSVVLGHDPWKRYRLHPDHRHAGLLACEGIVAARDPHFFPEDGLAPHRPDELLLWEADAPNHVEDVTGTVDIKLEALGCHASQFESTMHAADEAQLEAFRSTIRSRLADLGAPHGMAAAEVFARIDDL